MAWYHWTIIALILLAWWQYTYPTKAGFVGIAFDPVNSFIDKNSPFSTKPAAEDNNPCPDTNEPVCGSDGKTYQNICYAALADILQVTPGAC